jgi:broad specificity phosphatase PhoE
MSAAALMSGWTDVVLSPRGQWQAQAVGRGLIGERAAGQFTSSLQRALQTSARIAEQRGGEFQTVDALREIHCGEVDGMIIGEVQRQFPKAWAQNHRRDDDHFRWPGGESYFELRCRAVAAVEELVRRFPGETVIVVTHTGVITQLLGHLFGVPAARWDLFRVENGSITELRWKRDGATVKRLNDCHHLNGCDAAPLQMG